MGLMMKQKYNFVVRLEKLRVLPKTNTDSSKPVPPQLTVKPVSANHLGANNYEVEAKPWTPQQNCIFVSSLIPLSLYFKFSQHIKTLASEFKKKKKKD